MRWADLNLARITAATFFRAFVTSVFKIAGIGQIYWVRYVARYGIQGLVTA